MLFSFNDILNILGVFYIQQGRLGKSELGYSQASPIGINRSSQSIFQTASKHRETLGWGSSLCCSWVLPSVAVLPTGDMGMSTDIETWHCECLAACRDVPRRGIMGHTDKNPARGEKSRTLLAHFTAADKSLLLQGIIEFFPG